jgi:hypothetical protein
VYSYTPLYAVPPDVVVVNAVIVPVVVAEVDVTVVVPVCVVVSPTLEVVRLVDVLVDRIDV